MPKFDSSYFRRMEQRCHKLEENRRIEEMKRQAREERARQTNSLGIPPEMVSRFVEKGVRALDFWLRNRVRSWVLIP